MTLDAARARFRVELGLPERGSIVMTGHQCAVWHAGILAKYLAADALTTHAPTGQSPVHSEMEVAGWKPAPPNRFDHAAWLWVDQDTDETHSLRVPVRESGRLGARAWRIHAPPTGDIPTASVPAFRPGAFTGDPALPSVRAGIDAITGVLERFSGEPNAARQTAAAVSALMQPLMPGRRPRTVFATDLLNTSLGAALLVRMRENPRACADAYNRAVAANPRAKMTPLTLGGDDGAAELPLWRLAPGEPRRRVFARDLEEPGLDQRSLAPRALLMTGMVRLGACDIFIHGTGGGVYDTITDAWFAEWLNVALAPTIVVTSDLLLPLHPRDVGPADVAVARWKAHRARHDPALLGDPRAAAEKAALVGRIRAARSRGEDPLPHYRALHDLLEAARRAGAAQLAAYARAADEAAAMHAEREIARDRTWAFPFHIVESLRAMTIRQIG